MHIFSSQRSDDEKRAKRLQKAKKAKEAFLRKVF